MTLADSFISSGPRQSPFFWYSAHCSGRELSIVNCSLSTVPSSPSTNFFSRTSYTRYEAAAVVCRGSSSRNECEQGAVRLGNLIHTPKTIEGTVEICDNGVWAGVCTPIYPLPEGKLIRLVCKQLLGHEPKGNK